MGGGSQRIRGPGRAHKSGLGAGVMRSVNGGERASSSGRGLIGQYSHLFTTDLGDGRAANMQSVLDVSDLDEMMAMADLQGRSFAAERQNVVIVSMGGQAAEQAVSARAAARAAATAAAAGKLKVPRRPPWTKAMPHEELDAREREAFLIWRRDLATLEEGGDLGVTPFEKNLEVWRQLWRVLERSDLVCQVVDARDPLRYRCPDLEAYVDELGAGTKRALLLLNKADLLSPALRRAWARYFDATGVDYIFWSALAAAEPAGGAGAAAAASDAAALPSAPPAPAAIRTGARVVGRDELLRLLEARAALAALGEDGEELAAGAEHPDDVRFAAEPRRAVVGLVGWPNVGKSSTLNALIGEKRTGVGSTPGKTKHFQTFNLSDTLRLADCPGLVFPSFSDSRAEMVAAGVLPIDKLTDVVAPIDVVAARVPRRQLEEVYSLRLPRPAAHEDPKRQPTGRELLRAYAAARGLTAGSGLPDETRAGRAILKDYTSGKLLYCEWPPGEAREEAGGEGTIPEGQEVADWDSGEEEEGGSDEGSEADAPAAAQAGPAGTTASAAVGNALLGELKAMGLGQRQARGGAQVARAEHKLQKKGKKEKLRRLAKGPMEAEGIGGQLITGKRGGLMPAAAQIAPVPEFLPHLLRHSAGVAPGGARERTISGRPSRTPSRLEGEE